MLVSSSDLSSARALIATGFDYSLSGAGVSEEKDIFWGVADTSKVLPWSKAADSAVVCDGAHVVETGDSIGVGCCIDDLSSRKSPVVELGLLIIVLLTPVEKLAADLG